MMRRTHILNGQRMPVMLLTVFRSVANQNSRCPSRFWVGAVISACEPGRLLSRGRATRYSTQIDNEALAFDKPRGSKRGRSSDLDQRGEASAVHSIQRSTPVAQGNVSLPHQPLVHDYFRSSIHTPLHATCRVQLFQDYTPFAARSDFTDRQICSCPPSHRPHGRRPSL